MDISNKFGIGLGAVAVIGILFASGIKIIETGNVGVKSTIGQIDVKEVQPGFEAVCAKPI